MASARPEERQFKVALTMTRSDDSSPVFFKVDGERFKDSRTLKLQVDTTYAVGLEFRPPMVLRYMFPMASNSELSKLFTPCICKWFSNDRIC